MLYGDERFFTNFVKHELKKRMGVQLGPKMRIPYGMLVRLVMPVWVWTAVEVPLGFVGEHWTVKFNWFIGATILWMLHTPLLVMVCELLNEWTVDVWPNARDISIALLNGSCTSILWTGWVVFFFPWVVGQSPWSKTVCLVVGFGGNIILRRKQLQAWWLRFQSPQRLDSRVRASAITWTTSAQTAGQLGMSVLVGSSVASSQGIVRHVASSLDKTLTESSSRDTQVQLQLSRQAASLQSELPKSDTTAPSRFLWSTQSSAPSNLLSPRRVQFDQSTASVTSGQSSNGLSDDTRTLQMKKKSTKSHFSGATEPVPEDSITISHEPQVSNEIATELLPNMDVETALLSARADASARSTEPKIVCEEMHVVPVKEMASCLVENDVGFLQDGWDTGNSVQEVPPPFVISRPSSSLCEDTGWFCSPCRVRGSNAPEQA